MSAPYKPLLEMDLSKLEQRVLAMAEEDPVLKETRQMMAEAPTKEARDLIKRERFAFLYGSPGLLQVRVALKDLPG